MALDMKQLDAYHLRRAAAMLREAEARRIRREVEARQRKAFRPFERDLKQSALKMLPKRGGYAGIMARQIRVRIRRFGYDVNVTVYARGKAEFRDVFKVDRGMLRHPVWRHRRRPWATTKVPPGFVSIPAKRLEDRLYDEGLNGLSVVSIYLSRG